ncbi:hypothetical protein GE061_015029 [Apolygus lucorum]|uniref:C2H2-type domain-containing protein n=1 Tax=Apolygus lucorum TaxID=248454 RepID=A0A8S9XL12_APOLU|nr:hypothetical protein GE061_015029 [Apolygus lucorum]
MRLTLSDHLLLESRASIRIHLPTPTTMDYPDPDEEYELMHADEFELMNELEEEEFDFPRNVSKQTPKRQLNFSNCAPSTSEAKKPVKIIKPPDDEYPSDDDLMNLQEVPVPPSHDSKTSPSCNSNAPNLTSRNDASPRTSSNGLESNASCNEASALNDDILVSNKRTVSDLFGDITDLELELSSQTKRQKLEEEQFEKEARQDLLIRTIVEQRRKLNEEKSSFGLIRDQKVKKLEDCISYGSVPKWPFIPACVKGERIYIRLHAEEKIQKDLKNVVCNSRSTGLLGVSYKELHNLAMSEVSRKIDKLESKKKAVVKSADNKDLWVEKYKPKIYLQLLSDEATNRSLLYWLKLWDKVVFNKEPKVIKHGFPGIDKRELLDEHGRPVQKVALLCGPPGLGKTTLAHMIAKQAGYTPIEVNASDDRSAQAFRTHLESATQMKSVMSSNPNPNCLILDEIDGAPQAAIDVLIKYITDKDLGTMMVLSEKSNNDIRACLSILQYLKAKSPRITLGQVQSSNVGAKDMQQGLFTVWESVFQIKLSKKGQGVSLASKKPKLVYPSTAYDVASRIQRNRQVLDFLFSGMSPKLQSYQQRGNLLLDVAPMLVILITPNVRPVSIQLYTQKEKNELNRVVSVMADYNVNYSQMRTSEGHYNFVLDPNIEELVCFSDNPTENITTYTVRQLLSKEVECEKIRRSSAKHFSHSEDSNAKDTTPAKLPSKDQVKTPSLPNHLQKLTPKAIKKKIADGWLNDPLATREGTPVNRFPDPKKKRIPVMNNNSNQPHNPCQPIGSQGIRGGAQRRPRQGRWPSSPSSSSLPSSSSTASLNHQCAHCERAFTSRSGLGLHVRRKHPVAANAAIDIERIQHRYASKELRRLAADEAVAVHNGVGNINVYLSERFPTRTVIAIKNLCQKPHYKQLVQEAILANSSGASPASPTADVEQQPAIQYPSPGTSGLLADLKTEVLRLRGQVGRIEGYESAYLRDLVRQAAEGLDSLEDEVAAYLGRIFPRVEDATVTQHQGGPPPRVVLRGGRRAD